MTGCRPSPVLPAALLLSLAGCSVPVKVPEIPVLEKQDFAPARVEKEPAGPPRAPVEIPVPLPLPGQLKPVETPADPPKDATSPTTRIDQANETARVEPVKDGYINAIQNYPYTQGALYQVYAAVSQVTEIALQPGEKLVSFSSGDTLRWVVGDTTSGEGAGGRVHLLIKPVHPGLRTNGLITTDRRSYHLELHSTEKTYMASVSWTYPAGELLALRRQAEAAGASANAVAAPDIDLSRLNFRYRIEGDAPWRPGQVFDDGSKVYIQFPSGLSKGEAPPLFVVGPDAKPALVNYRVRGTTYIVDRLFAAAELRHGTAPQRIVRIVRTDAVWREARP
ncbi:MULTISPECIES: P-type conjugative transfer protein TrbG [Rhodomicrobium]|uniref:P-type conjugative transfer protein TrbG n=1 Tax=Rhodomicrobium TaxID=1068 RepID=UPI000B4BC1FF|nr:MULTISPECIES: P-type conjugative transfer protein TrbG [Rhodomicrobium]